MKNLVIILFVTIFSISQNLNSQLIPVVHYKFDGNFEDSSENNYDASNMGATFAEDRNGIPDNALYFNGIDSFINLPNEDDLKPAMPFTISFWIKYSSTSYDDQEVFELSYEENRNSGVYFNSEMSSGKMAINISNGLYNYIVSARKSYVSNNVIEVGEWINVFVVVNDHDDMEIYYDCDGIGGDYSGFANTLVYSDTNGVIGKRQRNLYQSPNYFHGYLDDFKIWDTALNESIINRLCDHDSLNLNSFENNLETPKIYPNPSNGFFKIKSSIQYEEIVVISQIGKTIHTYNYDNQIDLTHLSSGVYFLKFIKDESSDIKKIIIN